MTVFQLTVTSVVQVTESSKASLESKEIESTEAFDISGVQHLGCIMTLMRSCESTPIGETEIAAEKSAVKNRSQSSNRRKKIRVLKQEGIPGLIERNLKRREARDKNVEKKSLMCIRCAFECVGIKMFYIKRNRVHLANKCNDTKTVRESYGVNDECSTKMCNESHSRSTGGTNSTFDVDSQDEAK